MNRLRDVERHLHSLQEIRDILDSMKTLAYMETRKLGRFLKTQDAVVRNIAEAAADLLDAYPRILPPAEPAPAVYLLIGTERGFCGDFNRALLRHLDAGLPEGSSAGVRLVAVGHKLATQLGDDPRVAATAAGPSVAEEVPRLLQEIVDRLAALRPAGEALEVSCVYHHGPDEVTMQRLLPPFAPRPDRAPAHSHPPVLNQEPGEVLAGLAEQYVFAAIHQMLYSSLWAENSRRVTHLDGAVRHLDQQSAELTRQSHALRQEEIVEEIEVMLLSASDDLPSGQAGAPPFGGAVPRRQP